MQLEFEDDSDVQLFTNRDHHSEQNEITQPTNIRECNLVDIASTLKDTSINHSSTTALDLKLEYMDF